MSGFIDLKARRVLPRWRESRLSAQLGELDSTEPTPGTDTSARFDAEFKEKTDEWHATQHPAVAAELLSLGLSGGRRTAEMTAAAHSVLALGTEISDVLANLARDALSPKAGLESPLELRTAVQNLRGRTRADPRDSFAWLDLALRYTTAGQWQSAERAISAALGAAPNNRLVLRSAARYYIHTGNTERALALLTSRGNPEDPWLISARIATASLLQRPQTKIRRALQIVERGNGSPHHLSELSSSLGTLELESGAIRSARKLFRSALEDPTENSVAQAVWASQSDGAIEVELGKLAISNTHEANSRYAMHHGEWKSAFKSAKAWLADQPFSVEPVALSSVAASIEGSLIEESLTIIDRSLRANPGNWLLLNNRAFALASTGRWQEAERILPSPELHSEVAEKATLLATTGLIEYRKGNLIAGRAKYEAACELLSTDPRQFARATVMHLREAARVGSPDTKLLLERAERAAKSANYPAEVVIWLTRVKEGTVK